MQYPYLTLLEVANILLTLVIGLIVFYLLTKKWKLHNLTTAVKAFLLYELINFLFYLIYPWNFIYKILEGNSPINRALAISMFGILSFLIFYLINKKVLPLNFKRSLFAFLLIVVITLPLINFLQTVVVQKKIINLTPFSKEAAKMEEGIHAYFQKYGFGALLLAPIAVPPIPQPLSLQITGKITAANFTWPADLLSSIIMAASDGN